MITIKITWKDLSKEKQQEIINKTGDSMNDFDVITILEIEGENDNV